MPEIPEPLTDPEDTSETIPIDPLLEQDSRTDDAGPAVMLTYPVLERTTGSSQATFIGLENVQKLVPSILVVREVISLITKSRRRYDQNISIDPKKTVIDIATDGESDIFLACYLHVIEGNIKVNFGLIISKTNENVYTVIDIFDKNKDRIQLPHGFFGFDDKPESIQIVTSIIEDLAENLY